MKKTVLNIIVISLVASFFIGCATQGNRAEVWRDTETPNDFIGKWEGSVVQIIPKNDDNFMPETTIEITISLEYLQDAERVNGNMKVDFVRFLTDWSDVGVIKSSGMTKESLWEILTGEFGKNEEITVGGEYFITQDLSGDVDAMFSDGSKLQINGAGNRLKLIFPEAVSFGLGDSGFSEVILNKK
jgi:hypothetical protein